MSSTKPTVLITGCTPGGIGHALAVAFHRRNLHVIATTRPSSLATLAPLADLGLTTLALDVTSPASIAACVDAVTKLTNGQGLDYLVNNAGASYTVPALDISLADAKACFEVNFFGVVAVTQAFAPLLIQAKGTVVMVGSLAGVIPYCFGSIYNASKGALHAYSNTLRVELKPLGVTVITIVTGGVQTNISSHITRVLPEDSEYAELEAAYLERQGHSQVGAMAAEAYAASVVRQVLVGGGPWWARWLGDGRRRWVWEGNKSWVVYWIAGGWAWNGFFDWWFTRAFGLWRLRGGAKRKGI